MGCCKGGSMRAKDVRTRANRAMPRRSHSTDGDSGQTGPRVKQHRGQMEKTVKRDGDGAGGWSNSTGLNWRHGRVIKRDLVTLDSQSGQKGRWSIWALVKHGTVMKLSNWILVKRANGGIKPVMMPDSGQRGQPMGCGDGGYRDWSKWMMVKRGCCQTGWRADGIVVKWDSDGAGGWCGLRADSDGGRGEGGGPRLLKGGGWMAGGERWGGVFGVSWGREGDGGGRTGRVRFPAAS